MCVVTNADRFDDRGNSVSVDKRRECLDKARGYVTSDRATTYGDPEDNFTAIADIWNAQGVRIDGYMVTATDVALLMAGMKLARLRHNHDHEDSWVDLAGYAACGMDVADNANQRHDGNVEVFKHVKTLPNGVGVTTVSPREAVADFREGLRIVKRNDHAESGFTVTPFDKLLSNMGKKLDAHVGVAAVPNELGVWIGDNRCGDAIVHPAHGYDRDDNASGSHYAMWCDGYREVHSEPGA